MNRTVKIVGILSAVTVALYIIGRRYYFGFQKRRTRKVFRIQIQ